MTPTADLILQSVQLRCRIRIAWLKKIWTDKDSKETGPDAKYFSEVDGYLSNADNPDDERRWMRKDPFLQTWIGEWKQKESSLQKDKKSRLVQLAEIFSLNAFEKDIVKTGIAAELNPSLSTVFAYLHDHKNRGYISSSLVARLFDHGMLVHIGSESPLRKWEIITISAMAPGEPDRIDLDPSVLSWLLGNNQIDERLSGIAQLIEPKKPLAHWPVDSVYEEIKKRITAKEKMPMVALVTGPEGSGRTEFACILSGLFGKELIRINTQEIPELAWPAIFLRAQRETMLNPRWVLWKGEKLGEKNWSADHSSATLQWIAGEVEEKIIPHSGIIDLQIELEPIPGKQKQVLWNKYLPYAKSWDKDAVHGLLDRHAITLTQLETLSVKKPESPDAASDILKSAVRHRLGQLAQQLQSAYTWNDLVITDWLKNHLQDFYFEASERHAIWDHPGARRLFPQGRGLFALFNGPPGTGKTMAAQVLANALQLDLFRIDLSAVVSKYVGETSRNLEKILSRASRMNVVLLFDEADSLFGKRTEIKDAHDRFANTDTNYLLQALEQYTGIVILSTNRKSNIDDSLFRRTRFVLEFQTPDAMLRLTIWRQLIKELVDDAVAERLDPGLVQLANLLDMTGAQIKFSILSALFLTRRERVPMNIQHILRGIERELMKEGRGIGKQISELLKKNTM